MVVFVNTKLLWLYAQVCIKSRSQNLTWGRDGLTIFSGANGSEWLQDRDHYSPVHNYTPLCIWVVLTGLGVI